MKKILIIMMAVIMTAMMFTACGSESKAHTGHLARHESVKTDLFDGSLLTIK
jgi:hypothetical protein